MNHQPILRRSFLILASVLFAAATLGWYLEGITRMWETNPYLHDEPSTTYDQRFYMARAQDFALHQNEQMVARSRMPAYPWLLSWFYAKSPALAQKAQLETYMRVNVVLSIIALAGIYLLGRRLLGSGLALVVTLVAAFRFYVYKAVLAQPEITFYFLFLCLFLAMLHCLRNPTWRKCLALGILAGITQLFKASALPAIALFGLFLTVRLMLNWWHEKRHPTALGRKLGWRHILPLGSLAAGFLITMGGFMLKTMQHYGSPLYDPNSQHLFWANSPDEIASLQALNLAERKPELSLQNIDLPELQAFLSEWCPDAELLARLDAKVRSGDTVILEGEFAIVPSAKNYFKTHGMQDVLQRLRNGLFGPKGIFIQNFGHPNGYGKYILIFAGGAIALLILTFLLNAREVLSGLRANWLVILFALALLVGNLLLFAWLSTTAPYNRFFLTLLLPLLFAFGIIIAWCAPRLPIDIPFGKFRCKATSILVLGLTAFTLSDTAILDRAQFWKSDPEARAARRIGLDDANRQKSLKQSWKVPD